MKSTLKRVLSFLIAFAFVLGALPAILLTSAAENEEVTIENGSYSLSINKTHFEVGEEKTVLSTGFVQSKADNPVESFVRTDGEMHSVSYNALK